MKCPGCGFTESKVIDSRPTENETIRRRPGSLSCKNALPPTRSSRPMPILVVKKDGTHEIFDRNKILTGLVKSCYKRPVTHEQLNALVSEIENELQNSLHPEVKTSEIGSMVMDKLRQLDEVSYVRFASVYREFKDAETFMRELRILRGEKDSEEEE